MNLRRLVCLVRGHQGHTVVDRVELEPAGWGAWGFSVSGRILASHRSCLRCKRRLS